LNELKQSVKGIQSVIHNVVLDYGLAPSDASSGDLIDGLNKIADALGLADETETLLRAELAQLRAQSSELADVKLALEAAGQEKGARDSLIKELERRIAELSHAARRQSATSDSDREAASPVGSRMSFGRSATPIARIPALQPPPSMPPPPLPTANHILSTLLEGLPSPAQRDAPLDMLNDAKGHPASPRTPAESPSMVKATSDKTSELLNQINAHAKTIAELQTRLSLSELKLKEVGLSWTGLGENATDPSYLLPGRTRTLAAHSPTTCRLQIAMVSVPNDTDFIDES
jgi:hypothetical protein